MNFIISEIDYRISNKCDNKPVVHGAMECGQNRFKLVWLFHQLMSGFLAKGHLSRVSRESRRSLMIRVIMKWSWGLCTDLLAFALHLRETPENLS
jgi:hypothetical protein